MLKWQEERSAQHFHYYCNYWFVIKFMSLHPGLSKLLHKMQHPAPPWIYTFVDIIHMIHAIHLKFAACHHYLLEFAFIWMKFIWASSPKGHQEYKKKKQPCTCKKRSSFKIKSVIRLPDIRGTVNNLKKVVSWLLWLLHSAAGGIVLSFEWWW